MLAMSEKKKDTGSKPKRMGRPPKDPMTPVGGRSKHLIGARISQELAERFDKFCDGYNRLHPRTERSAHVEKAMVEYLDRQDAAK